MAMTAYEANNEKGISGGILGMTAKGPLPRQAPDFTSPVATAAEEVQMLRIRIEQLADKLCGSVPETDGSGIHSVPSGVFETVMEHGRNISGDVVRARDALDRIERALP